MRSHKSSLSRISLRPVSIDDISAIRYVHAEATRFCAARYLDEDDTKAMTASVYSEEYIHDLVAGGLTGAWVGSEIVGTVGWKAAGAAPKTARLHMLFVWPLFSRLGIGGMLVAHAEAQAYAAGFRGVRARTTAHQAGFFKRLGYAATAQSALRTSAGGRVPIVYLRKDAIFPDVTGPQKAALGAGRFYRH
jgi:GNAT superfamily N-acetyltransferase